MTFRRALAGALFGLAVAAVAPVTAASAAAPASYPPDPDVSLTLSASVLTVGDSVTAFGSGFAPNSTVAVTTTQTSQGFAGSVTRNATLGSFQPESARTERARVADAVQRLAAVGVLVDASGSFRTTLTFNTVGTYVVNASGISATGQTASASATLQVVAVIGGGSGGDDNGAGDLPNTGASIGLPVTLGVVLLLAGAGLTTVVRRRKREDVSV